MEEKLIDVKVQGTGSVSWPKFEVVHPTTGEVRQTTQPEFEKLQAEGFVKKTDEKE